MKDLPAKLYADGYTVCDSNGRVLAESRSMRLVTVLVELYNERQAVLEKMRAPSRTSATSFSNSAGVSVLSINDPCRI